MFIGSVNTLVMKTNHKKTFKNLHKSFSQKLSILLNLETCQIWPQLEPKPILIPRNEEFIKRLSLSIYFFREKREGVIFFRAIVKVLVYVTERGDNKTNIGSDYYRPRAANCGKLWCCFCVNFPSLPFSVKTAWHEPRPHGPARAA